MIKMSMLHVAAILGVACGCAAAPESVPGDDELSSSRERRIVCTELVVQDREGNPRIRLVVDSANRTRVSLLSANGANTITLTAEPDGKLATVRLEDDSGRAPLVLRSDGRVPSSEILLRSNSSDTAVTLVASSWGAAVQIAKGTGGHLPGTGAAMNLRASSDGGLSIRGTTERGDDVRTTTVFESP